MQTEHLRQREEAITRQLAQLSQRELVHLIYVLQTKPRRNRRDALYTVRYMDMFQADQIRGIGGMESPTPGRRVLAQRMHDPAARNPLVPGGPQGGVKVAADGSVAAIVPAQRAMTWQLSDPNQLGVVRERYWVTFQPGEIRVCASCHGLNSVDQASRGVPMNKPEALRELLRFYKTTLKTPGRPRTVRR